MARTTSLDVRINPSALVALLNDAERLVEASHDALADPEFARSSSGRRLRLAVVEFEGSLNSHRAGLVEVRG